MAHNGINTRSLISTPSGEQLLDPTLTGLRLWSISACSIVS